MDIQLQEAGDVKVAVFVGSLDTNTASEAEQTFGQVIAAGGSKILADFTQLAYISSAGLRVLLATAKQLRGAGGDLRLCGLNETVQEVLDISGFSSILTIAESQADALQGF